MPAQTCLGIICSHTGWPLGHAYLEVDQLSGLVSRGIWHTKEEGRFAAFREVTGRSTFADESGLAGCFLGSGKPRWIVNLADEQPLSERTRVAVEAGLRSAFAFPIVVNEKIIGLLEFFSLHTVQPDEEFLTILGTLAPSSDR